MKSLKHHIVENANAARGARKHPRRDREPVAMGVPVRVIHSLGLDGATVSLPAGIDLQTRAELVNAFWRALVQFQDRDVVVVAMLRERRALSNALAMSAFRMGGPLPTCLHDQRRVCLPSFCFPRGRAGRRLTRANVRSFIRSVFDS
jgi:hypothetical protein